MNGSRHRLSIDVVCVLALKAVLLTTIYYVCFGPSHQVHVDAAQLAQHLLSGSNPTAGK